MIEPLAAWESFYVIVGSSAAALTGLQFVVIALIAESGRRSTGHEIAAFGTPTIVHFSVALLVSAILSAPWQAFRGPGIALLLTGLAGLAYDAVVLRRAVRQRGYRPVLEDWVWHTILPVTAHVALLVAGVRLADQPGPALFATAGATLLLVFIGIHNAWDTVTYITVNQWRFTRDEGAGTTPTDRPPPPAAGPAPDR